MSLKTIEIEPRLVDHVLSICLEFPRLAKLRILACRITAFFLVFVVFLQ